MDVARPYAVLTDALESEVLRVLAGTTLPISGRHVHRLAHRGSDRGIQYALNRLVDQGLVSAQEAPPAILYTLNRDHLAAPIAEALAELRMTFIERMREALAQWAVPAEHASLFGSAARADGDTLSDIDLVLVRPGEVATEDPRWRAQVDGLADAVGRWTGNRASLVELSPEDVLRLSEERAPIIDELTRDAITLAGQSFRELAGR
ncbi:MAG: hypothetical protein ACRDL0_09235 [Thermoleophilaceae bacterium]